MVNYRQENKQMGIKNVSESGRKSVNWRERERERDKESG